MRFTVHSKKLPWRVRLALLLGGHLFAGAFEHAGRTTITVGVEHEGEIIWWETWETDQRSYFDTPKTRLAQAMAAKRVRSEEN